MNIRRLAVVAAMPAIFIWQCGCTQQDNEQAKRKLHAAGQELKQETKEATKKLKDGAHEASRELKQGGEKLKRDAHSK